MWNKIVSPMLLSEDSVIPEKNYIYELKYDGMRAIVYISNTIKIISRNKKDITYLFPEFNNIIKLVNKNCILDGEIICISNGKPDFNKLQNRIHLKDNRKILSQSMWNRAIFVCFDILYYGKDMCYLPYLERRKILDNISENDVFVKSKIFYNGKKLFKAVKKLGLEGIVCKEVNSKYFINKRSEKWIKIKNYKYSYFYIGAYSYTTNNTISVYLGEFNNNFFYYVGTVLVSRKDNLYNKILECEKSKNLFINIDDNVNYVKPYIKIKIKYTSRTNNNYLREASYVG